MPATDNQEKTDEYREICDELVGLNDLLSYLEEKTPREEDNLIQ